MARPVPCCPSRVGRDRPLTLHSYSINFRFGGFVGGKFAEAAAQLTRALEAFEKAVPHEDEPAVSRFRKEASLNIKPYHEARAEFDLSLELLRWRREKPDGVATNFRGWTLALQGNSPEAQKFFDATVVPRPDLPERHLRCAKAELGGR